MNHFPIINWISVLQYPTIDQYAASYCNEGSGSSWNVLLRELHRLVPDILLCLLGKDDVELLN